MLILTTVGKLIFNEILPESFPYMNEPTDYNLSCCNTSEIPCAELYRCEKGATEREVILPFKKGFLGNIIAEVFKKFKITETSKMLDRMKDLGFKYSTKAGITVGVADIVVLGEKKVILAEAEEKVERILKTIPSWSNHRRRAL